MTMLLDPADITVLSPATAGPFDRPTLDVALDDAICIDPSCFYCRGPETD